MEQRDITQRVDNFDLEATSEGVPFRAQLARENGWSMESARRASVEYKRFCALTVLNPGLVPSVTVDKVWHQHLLLPRSYARFCEIGLGKWLDHCPGTGSADERARFAAGYERTLTLYRQNYGEPPARIWPSPAERFRRSATAPARRFAQLRRYANGSLLGFMLLSLVSCGGALDRLGNGAWCFIALFAGLLSLALFGGQGDRSPAAHSERSDDETSNGCETEVHCGCGG